MFEYVCMTLILIGNLCNAVQFWVHGACYVHDVITKNKPKNTVGEQRGDYRERSSSETDQRQVWCDL